MSGSRWYLAIANMGDLLIKRPATPGLDLTRKTGEYNGLIMFGVSVS
jgi:hypothetical protein